MTSISGAGNGEKGAKATAEVCNQIHPKLIGANMLTIYPNSELYQEIKKGTWKEEEELEKYGEIRTLIEALHIPVEFAALGASNAIPIVGILPRDRDKLLTKLDEIIENMSEEDLWQLKKLRAMGVNGLSIGTESGDDDTLLLANKGYTSKDILEQCRKLDEAGIEYYFVYMTGLAGKGGGYRNAVNSAEIFSQLNPYFISVDSLTLFSDTTLHEMAKRRNFIPAGEMERLQELQVFIKNLRIRTHLFANSKSNFYPLLAFLPKERESILEEIQQIINTFTEEEMLQYRNSLKTL